LIDLLSRAFEIEEGDPPERVREKVEEGIKRLVGKKENITPYVGSLYALGYPEIEGVSPEFWKSRLQEAIQAVLSALTRRGPTVICLEDLHWADPTSIELLRTIVTEFRSPALFLCVYRPPFSLLTSHQVSGMGKLYQEIRLQDLSPSEAQGMVESLLKTETIPSELGRFVQDRLEGNPFYLEEVINALIESEALLPDNGTWKLERPIRESDIPSTVQGVISARLDRLEGEMKRVLQEASVIGRAFLYEILKKITDLKEQADRCLHELEQLDLIRTRVLQPDLEYIFKHALTQEVVYNGLLKKERQEIHERIGLVMEELFHDRLSEFSETLAFHFKQGQSLDKAVDYLVRSGEKSLKRYAVEESHQYFREAFDLLSNKPDQTRYEAKLLIDLLIKWAYVFYYRGDFRELENLLSTHLSLAESLEDKARLGMFYGWLGMALWPREKFEDSSRYLKKALTVGEEIGDQHVIGYACTWLTWTCAELGFLDDALVFGERAQEISKSFESDHYLYLKSLGGMGHTYCFRGERDKAFSAGRALLEYGQRHSNSRSMVMGYYVLGSSHFMDGDFPSAIECSQKGVEVSADPYYAQIPKTLLGTSYASNGQFEEAENTLKEVVDFSQRFGTEVIGTIAQASLGVVALAKGRLSRGVKMLEDGRRVFLKNQRRWFSAQYECILGRIYLQMMERARPISLSIMAKEITFLAKDLPFARKRAEDHLHTAMEIAQQIGAKGVLGQAHFDLGLLHKAKGRKEQAKKWISQAVDLFEQCQAEVYLKRAREALESLE
jgi:tetratricopeptide (TPR) repeat protein